MFCTNSLSQFYEICTKGDIMTFYERLKELMDKTGTTQKQLTELGINKNSFNYWKSHGNIPKPHILEPIAKYFNVSVAYLMTGIETKNEQADHEDQPASEEMQRLLQETSTLSDDEARKVREYVELLKLKRNQESS